MNTSKTLVELIGLIMQQAKDKGFGTKPEDINVAEKVALIHSEISEAFEAYRHKDMEGDHGFKMELADAITRIFHLCGVLDINIEEALIQKLQNNKDRTWEWNKMNEGHN